MAKNTQSIFERFPQLKEIPAEKFPKHIFIIPDGNGRWAKAKNQFVTFGHTKGFEVVEQLLEDLSQLQYISVVTFWGFACDNWKRSAEEIKGLMFIFTHMLKKTFYKIQKRKGKFIHIGRKDRFPKELVNVLQESEEKTKINTGQIVCAALDFGGEDQNIRVIEKARKLSADIPTTPELLWQLRDGQGLVTSADLLIRTSGEKRTSDIGWLNGSSTELYFIDKLFPDVTTEDIVDAIVDFSKRERRFGGRK